MVKKHSTKDRILMLMLSNKGSEFTIRAISKSVSIDYKTVYLVVKELIDDQVMQARKAGQTTLCSLNPKQFNADIFRAEFLRREDLLRNKDMSVLHGSFKEIREPFFILLLFGSRASGKAGKGSDIDLMLITDNEKTRKMAKNAVSLIPLQTHLVDFSSGEFISMLRTTEFSVGKEAANNNIILFGIEDYYRILENA